MCGAVMHEQLSGQTSRRGSAWTLCRSSVGPPPRLLSTAMAAWRYKCQRLGHLYNHCSKEEECIEIWALKYVMSPYFRPWGTTHVQANQVNQGCSLHVLHVLRAQWSDCMHLSLRQHTSTRSPELSSELSTTGVWSQERPMVQ